MNQGRPVTAAVPYASPSTFKVGFRKARLATREDVIEVLQPRSARIVDARSDAEHTGERAMSERGGRIPGACPVEWCQLVDADGRFLPAGSLLEKLRAGGVKEGDAVVSHCQGAAGRR